MIKKKNLLGAVIFSALAVNAMAQSFYQTYPDQQTVFGFDLKMVNGNYYYSGGGQIGNKLLEINSASGAVIHASGYTGWQKVAGNPYGKNSIEVNPNGSLISAGIGQAFGAPNIDFRFVETADAGTSFSPVLGRNYPVSNGEFQYYSDQTGVFVSHLSHNPLKYFIGTRPTASSRGVSSPFILRTDGAGFTEYGYIMPQGTVGELVPTRIVEGENGAAFVSYASLSTNFPSPSYVSHLTKREAGIFAVNNDFTLRYNYTYHTTNSNQHLGAAQSIIKDGTDYLTFVASGSHANYPGNSWQPGH